MTDKRTRAPISPSEAEERATDALERLEELFSRFLVELDETLSSIVPRSPGVGATRDGGTDPGREGGRGMAGLSDGPRRLGEEVSEVREPVAEPWGEGPSGSFGPAGSGGPPSIDALIDAMTPRGVPTAPAVLQARRNSAARAALIEELGLLTSAEVAELNRSEAENRAALASRWKREGRIFSVRHHGRDYFPGFQLRTDGPPREVIADVLKALGGGEPHARGRGWETALWFTGANGHLGGRRPVDLLESDPEAVVAAAEHEAAEVYF